jgi:hypothetical protein
MKTKLKDCPFCGSKAFLINRINKLWAVGCTNLNCFAWECDDKKCVDCGGYAIKSKAIESWNRRELKRR